MVLVGTVAFEGYREWTESLGPDREWFIQLVQARTYQVIQSFTAEHDGMALPLRYDIQLVLLPSNVNPEAFINGVKEALKPYSPTPVRVALLCGEIPSVLSKARKYLELGDYYEECVPREIAVAHADLNYFTHMTSKDGPYSAYVEVMRLVNTYVESLAEVAIVQYLGGDNLVAVTEPSNLDAVIQELIKPNHIKVGIGISRIPRKAFSAAATALTRIREGGRRIKYLVLKEE